LTTFIRPAAAEAVVKAEKANAHEYDRYVRENGSRKLVPVGSKITATRNKHAQ